MTRIANKRDFQPIAIVSLIAMSKRGDFPLPDDLLTAYDELEQHLREHTDLNGDLVSNRAANDADALARHMQGKFDSDRIITEHLQPTLDDLFTEFRQDLTRAGTSGTVAQVDASMLTLPDDTRAAILKLHCGYFGRYGTLRSAWQTVYESGYIDVSDPLGARSPLTEVRNMPELCPDWYAAFYGRTPWPWDSAGQAFHLKFGWIVTHDGQPWLPTRLQHQQSWAKHNPNAVSRPAA